ncbi:unnamed protein product [Linum trigynum]|uniref:Uncharacterized protein n=1 Tax=Linum trigynum TaxID=586398 RepID=A0AAV2DDQ9_9ROSI
MNNLGANPKPSHTADDAPRRRCYSDALSLTGKEDEEKAGRCPHAQSFSSCSNLIRRFSFLLGDARLLFPSSSVTARFWFGERRGRSEYEWREGKGTTGGVGAAAPIVGRGE